MSIADFFGLRKFFGAPQAGEHEGPPPARLPPGDKESLGLHPIRWVDIADDAVEPLRGGETRSPGSQIKGFQFSDALPESAESDGESEDEDEGETEDDGSPGNGNESDLEEPNRGIVPDALNDTAYVYLSSAPTATRSPPPVSPGKAAEERRKLESPARVQVTICTHHAASGAARRCSKLLRLGERKRRPTEKFARGLKPEGDEEGRLVMRSWGSERRMEILPGILARSKWLRERLDGKWKNCKGLTFSLPRVEACTALFLIFEHMQSQLPKSPQMLPPPPPEDEKKSSVAVQAKKMFNKSENAREKQAGESDCNRSPGTEVKVVETKEKEAREETAKEGEAQGDELEKTSKENADIDSDDEQDETKTNRADKTEPTVAVEYEPNVGGGTKGFEIKAGGEEVRSTPSQVREAREGSFPGEWTIPIGSEGTEARARNVARGMGDIELLEATALSLFLGLPVMGEACVSELQIRITPDILIPCTYIARDLKHVELLATCYQYFTSKLLAPGILRKSTKWKPRIGATCPLAAYRLGINRLNPWEHFLELWETIMAEGAKFATPLDERKGVFQGILHRDRSRGVPVYIIAKSQRLKVDSKASKKGKGKLELKPVVFAHEVEGTGVIRIYSQETVTVITTLEANKAGTGFIIHGAGVDGIRSGLRRNPGLFPASPQKGIATVEYDINLLGNVPRRIIATLRGGKSDRTKLFQKVPRYSETIKGYALKFDDPNVRLPSKKNFILTLPANEDDDKDGQTVLLCGKMARSIYRVRVHPPLSLSQGFGILLSAFYKKALVR